MRGRGGTPWKRIRALGQGGGEFFPEPDGQCCQAVRTQPRGKSRAPLIFHSDVSHFLRSRNSVAPRSRSCYASCVSCPVRWTSLLKSGAHWVVDLWWRMKTVLGIICWDQKPTGAQVKWVIGGRQRKPVTKWQLTVLLPEYIAPPLCPILLLQALFLSFPITPAELWLQGALACPLTTLQGPCSGLNGVPAKFMST